MKIKTGDNVYVLAGKDRGKTGKVMQVFIKLDRVVVEGINLSIKHQKPRRAGEKGQRIQFPAPITISNLALVCPKCQKRVRVAYRLTANEAGKSIKERICRSCQEVI